jgi:tetratricopeptide (TPR) repeat protein
MARAFIIRPFGPKQDSAGKLIDFERVHRELIEPALTAVGCGGGTTGQIVEAGNIREDMFALIIEADLVVCDITVHNANVFYELGIRHALRKKRTVLLKGEPTQDGTPFDVLTDRYVAYDIDNPSAAKDALIETLKTTLASEREPDSPIFKMLPGLAEADPERVQAVPMDFTEEVGRARAARSAGWLRLLATEVIGRRFQWPGLRMVAQAQWDLKDYGGARKSWEKILEINPEDISANLALSNIYERLYRDEPDPILLERSNQAIARVLQSGAITRDQRAETLALAGRNRKTLWRRDLAGSNTVDERRTRATNRAGLEVYESYWKAFREDLNHYWSGLAALQMGSILLDLSQDPVWEDLFDVAAAAEQYQTNLKQQVDALTVTVRQSIEAALSRLRPTDPDRR